MKVTPKKILSLSLLYRLSSIYTIQTTQTSEESWKSLEITPKLNNFGSDYPNWEWRQKTASYIYPFIITMVQKILECLYLDFPIFLTYSPKIFQALLSAYADYRFYCWLNCTWTTTILMVNCLWFVWAANNLANTLEATLTIIALSIYPLRGSKDEKPKEDCKFLWIVGFLCTVRSPTAIGWIPLCAYHLVSNKDIIGRLTSQYLKIAMITLAYTMAIDSYCYGAFVFLPGNYLKINILDILTSCKKHLSELWMKPIPPTMWLFYLHIPLSVVWMFCKSSISPDLITLNATVYWNFLLNMLSDHMEIHYLFPIFPVVIYLVVKAMKMMKLDKYEFRHKLAIFGLGVALSCMIIVSLESTFSKELSFSNDLFGNEWKTCETENFKKNMVNIPRPTPDNTFPPSNFHRKNITTYFNACKSSPNGNDNDINGNKNVHPTKSNQQPLLVAAFDNFMKKISKLLKDYKGIFEDEDIPRMQMQPHRWLLSNFDKSNHPGCLRICNSE